MFHPVKEVLVVTYQKCPKCSGGVWDNRTKKASGEFKVNSPDFTCKAKCGWSMWLDAKAPAGAPKKAPARSIAQAVAPAGKVSVSYDWLRLRADYVAAVAVAVEGLTRGLGCAPTDLDQQAVQAGAATLLIHASRGDYPVTARATPPAPEQMEEVPAALAENDDLPF